MISSASFSNVPFEVVDAHIFAHLPLPYLMSCSMVSKLFRSLVLRHLKNTSYSHVDASSLHLEFFRQRGSLSLWIFLQKCKAIPVIHFMNIKQKSKCTALAARCKCLPILRCCPKTALFFRWEFRNFAVLS